MEERTFVGYNFGRFQTDTGRMQDYCNVFLLESFGGEENEDYHFGGIKALKYKCTNPALFDKIEINTQVYIYFDNKGRVCYMQAVQPKPAK